MAWPFGTGSSGNKSAEQAQTEERMKILSNVAIEQVPLPGEGELAEEDAWTISAGPTRAKLDSIGSVPTVSQAMSPAPVAQAAGPTTVDTSGLERMLSSRFDSIEDAISIFESKLQSLPQHVDEHEYDEDEADHEDGETMMSGGDRVITASGEVRTVAGTQRMMEEDKAPLVELYEAQALAANPFLVAPDMQGSHESSVGAPTVAALLLDNMSGMAAVSFTQKAIDSGMLTADEGKQVLSIVQLASPGESDAALNDHLPHRALLTFSALISSWRGLKHLRGEE